MLWTKVVLQVQGARVEAPSSLAVVTLNDGQPSYQFYREDTAERQVSMDSLRFSAHGYFCVSNWLTVFV